MLYSKKITFGLFSRMLAALLILLISALTFLSINILKNSSDQFDSFRLDNAHSLAHSLAEGSLDALITEDYEILERFVNSSVPSHYGAYAHLTRPNGQVLSSTDLNLIAKKIPVPKTNGIFLKHQTTYKNSPVIEIIHRIEISDEHIANAHVAYFSDKGSFNYLEQAKNIIFTLTIVIFFILTGAYFIVYRIKTPIIDLINIIENASHKTPINLPPRIYSRNDEVGTLARAFDRVFSQLSSATRTVQNARDTLERRVNERTYELEEKNKELDIEKIRINSIMDNAGDGIITINESGTIESFNLAAQKLFDYGAEEIIGKDINILIPESYHNKHVQHLKKYNETGTNKIMAKGSREVLGKRKDSSSFPVEISVNRVKTNKGNILIGIVRDITKEKEDQKNLLQLNYMLEQKVSARTLELKQSNEEMIVARDSALKASKLKSEFISNISHELRTPLHAITGYEDLLSTTDLNVKQTKYCKNINTSASKLLELITDMLDFSSYESNEYQVTIQVFTLSDMFNEIDSMMKNAAKDKKLDLSFHINDDLPAVIATDLKLIKSPIVCFISNAIKFTQQGGITINASTNNDPNTNLPMLNIKVTDTGIGVSDEELEHIFVPFYQTDGSSTRIEGGTGIGLAMAKKSSEMLGGYISVESILGQGSSFTLSIPMKTSLEND